MTVTADDLVTYIAARLAIHIAPFLGQPSVDFAAAKAAATLPIAEAIILGVFENSGGGGGGGGHAIQDEGVPLAAQPVLNFVGPGVVATDGVGETVVTIAGGGAGTVTSVGTGTGLTGGPITTSGTVALANTAVTPASYTNLNATVDAQGRITAAANGSAGVVPNAPITPDTKTKITYDAKGLVTAGAAATTADIPDSTNKRYVTDADLTDIGNLSGVNAGDQTITLTGDVTGSGTGSFAAAIAADAVTYAKIQNVSATQRVLGRNTAGAGDPEELTINTILEWLGTARGDILFRGDTGPGTPTWKVLAAGAAGRALVSNGPGTDPSYQVVAGVGTPSVAITDAVAPSTVNLTTEGTIDWYATAAGPATPGAIGYGTAIQHKATGGFRICSCFRWIVGGKALLTTSNPGSTVTYSATAADNGSGIAALSANTRATLGTTTANLLVDRGFGMRVPAAASSRTLRVYWANVTGTSGVVTVTATLDDGTTHSITTNYDASNLYRKTEIVFQGAGQDCNVTFIVTAQPTATASYGFACATLA